MGVIHPFNLPYGIRNPYFYLKSCGGSIVFYFIHCEIYFSNTVLAEICHELSHPTLFF